MFLIKKKFLSSRLINYYIENSKNHTEFESKISGNVDKKIKNRKDIYYSRKESFLLDRRIFIEKSKIIKEIKEKFNIKLKYREPYKLGTYYGKDKSHRGIHRDNRCLTEKHRQISMIICLSNSSDYSGGWLNIIDPIYKNKRSFKLDKGDVIFFDSGLRHYVDHVTKGKRQVIISFMWGEKKERKRHTAEYRNIKKYIPNI